MYFPVFSNNQCSRASGNMCVFRLKSLLRDIAWAQQPSCYATSMSRKWRLRVRSAWECLCIDWLEDNNRTLFVFSRGFTEYDACSLGHFTYKASRVICVSLSWLVCLLLFSVCWWDFVDQIFQKYPRLQWKHLLLVCLEFHTTENETSWS